jgi:adenine deaminase
VNFNVLKTFIDGTLVAENGVSLISLVMETPLNNFKASFISEDDIQVKSGDGLVRVIQALNGQLITKEILAPGKTDNGSIVSDIEKDILKIVVKDRYSDSPPSVGFISGFGLKEGAICSSVAHDSHNIIAVGADDHSITEAINLVVSSQGGISLISRNERKLLKLPYAGIMTNEDGYLVASDYETFDKMAKEMGSRLHAPYMTLSFMALLVIPEIKISDRGLFDGKNFRFIDLMKKQS